MNDRFDDEFLFVSEEQLHRATAAEMQGAEAVPSDLASASELGCYAACTLTPAGGEGGGPLKVLYNCKAALSRPRDDAFSSTPSNAWADTRTVDSTLLSAVPPQRTPSTQTTPSALAVLNPSRDGFFTYLPRATELTKGGPDNDNIVPYWHHDILVCPTIASIPPGRRLTKDLKCGYPECTSNVLFNRKYELQRHMEGHGPAVY